MWHAKVTLETCAKDDSSLIGTSYNRLLKLREKETDRIMGAWLREGNLIYAAGFTRPLGSHKFASSPEITDKYHRIAKLSQQLLYLETGPEKFPSLCTGSTLFFHSCFCVLFSYRPLSPAWTPQNWSLELQKSPSEMLRKIMRLCLS